MLHRFFIPPHLFADETITLPQEIARQVRSVLRLRPGEHIVVLNGLGDEAEIELIDVSRERVSGHVLERRPGLPEPQTHVTLCQGLLKADLFEWVLQKGTELGVSAFVPIQSERVLPGLETVSPARMSRWQTILREAAEQCGRSRIPTLSPPQPFERLLADLPAGALALVCWEAAREPSLRSFLHGEGWDLYRQRPTGRGEAARTAGVPVGSGGAGSIWLFIGPRDGLTAEEAQYAAEQGAEIVTLGPRILRAETAALAAATILLYESHNLEEQPPTAGTNQI